MDAVPSMMQTLKTDYFDYLDKLTVTEVVTGAVKYGLPIVGALTLFVLSWMASGTVRKVVRRNLLRAKIDETLTKFVSNLARWAILLLAAQCCVQMLGGEMPGLTAVLGATGLAIGLAMQGTISNIAAGAMLLIFRPYKVGDEIAVAGQTGKVDEIELFTTTLDTSDNRRIIVPNGSIFNSVIENLTHHRMRRLELTVQTALDEDLDGVREVLLRAADSVPQRLAQPAAAVVLHDLTPAAVIWKVQVWADRPSAGGARETLIFNVKAAMDHAGVRMTPPPAERIIARWEGGTMGERPADSLLPRRRAA